MKEPKEVPPGCEPAPGFILEIGRKHWLTDEGTITDQWKERGVWETIELAEQAKQRVLDAQ